MTSKDQDTDPSTPGSLRGLAPTDPTPAPMVASAHVSTDPGVGPPSRPPMPAAMPAPGFGSTQRMPTPSMGITVPASMRIHPRKDSVELLLDGMQGPQPERPKTMPATDGQASAAYHAEHGVRPARTSPDEMPKVVVERLPQAPTTRIDRQKVQAVIEAADARRRAMEATAEVPQQIGPRVIVAIVAGLVVVLGLFVVAKLMMGNGATVAGAPPVPPKAAPAASPVAPPATVTAATASPPATAAATATTTEVASASPTPTADPAPADTAPPPRATATAWGPAPSARTPKIPRTAPASTAGSSDIGEFKTIFH